MKNKIITVLLLSVITSSIVGCGCGTAKTEQSKPEVVAEVETEIEEDTEIVEEVTEVVAEVIEEPETEEPPVEEAPVEETPVEEAPVEEPPKEEAPVENLNPYNIVDCDPVTKYTNTGSNIRSIPDKNGDLVNTVSINTEVLVTGTTDMNGGWSRIEYGGLVSYIKSSLLSDSKTEVKQPSKPSGGNTQANSGGGSSEPAPSQPAPAPQPDPNEGLPSSGSTVSSMQVVGTTGGHLPNMGGGY